eukprot:c16431_g1_i1 orf=41-733(+)
MEGEGRWSSEALQAMETHLWLLQKANQCETDKTVKRPSLSRQCETDMGPHVDLNSHVPLPHGWEQFLDLRTGQVYYIDWKRCRRSYTDPRMLLLEHENFDDTEVSECTSDADNCHASNIHDAIEVNTKLITSPMLPEDWSLMEIRGWMSLESDDHSEVTSEVSSPNHVFSVLGREVRSASKVLIKERSFSSCECVCESTNAKVDFGMDCHYDISHLLSPAKSLCCGDALV